SEARYRNLFESASDAIATFDANGRFTTFNHAAEIISGYRREELVGQWFAPMLPDDELPKALANFQKALTGETGLFETSFYRKDGDVRTIQVTYSTPQRDEEVLCVIRDVTDQKMLQEQLIQSEKMSAIGQQVFLNLITNAEQAMERSERDKQHLVVRTRRVGEALRIEVEDTGPGIPPNLLERIFNPFFTTKPTGSGTGLGLSISLGIVREHE